ncbi:putative autophagy-related protein 28 protein [Rosellinia necatrix]|uniref:Putative autophagy-related protein 28 protein n=1 Tax=Rosellinia necatrix TaxID=77044 RepID=A0A1S7UM62_ROSNE|nr:putative autophagy-related protein 28 protein [Rosellinia necatrix]
MSATANLFSELGAGVASLLTQNTSRPSYADNEHDLAELSPWSEPAPLASAISDNTRDHGSSSTSRNSANPIHMQSKGDKARPKASIRSGGSPLSSGRSGGSMYSYGAGEGEHKNYGQDNKLPGIWHPSYLPDTLDPQSRTTGPQPSFLGSIFMARPTYAERSLSFEVDRGLHVIERRERQMQQEIQQLLDAQDYALEKHLASTVPGENDSTQSSETTEPGTSDGHIVPVRQPKKRHLSKREARQGILRCMSTLFDLRTEEKAYITNALAVRKAALSRLLDLSTKRKSIVAEMNTIESDRNKPLKDGIQNMERQHRTICDDILKLEEKLRDLKRTKTELESRISEAKSVRDSELSGYKGALKECDKRISDFMSYPEVPVLEVQRLIPQDADLAAQVGQHISGLEFLSLRPERRTLPMAKDWWEGEVEVLELRKAAINNERSALKEGKKLWQKVLDFLEDHDQHLRSTFEAMAKYSTQQTAPEINEMSEMLKRQYTMCSDWMCVLAETLDYTEKQGWNLLMTALGAELNYFQALKLQLAETLRLVGWADGTVTPQPGTPPRENTSDEGDLLSVDRDGAKTGARRDLDEELTGSVLRRWNRVDELRRSASQTTTNTSLDGVFGQTGHREDSDSDNEVPPDLISEMRRGSEDGHNDVPIEFLTMHSPSPKSRKGKGKAIAKSDPGLERGNGREKRGTKDTNAVGDDEEKHLRLSRESSANEVPLDLLSESRRSLD